jgi:hypothetical protein
LTAAILSVTLQSPVAQEISPGWPAWVNPKLSSLANGATETTCWTSLPVVRSRSSLKSYPPPRSDVELLR